MFPAPTSAASAVSYLAAAAAAVIPLLAVAK